MAYLELACPYCSRQFSAAASTESRTSACPHCHCDVTVPAVPPPVPTSISLPPAPPPLADSVTSAPALPQPALPPEIATASATAIDLPKVPASTRRLTPAERARLRRRLNIAFAVIGMAILAITLLALLRLRP